MLFDYDSTLGDEISFVLEFYCIVANKNIGSHWLVKNTNLEMGVLVDRNISQKK
jgi:hypothetical protein